MYISNYNANNKKQNGEWDWLQHRRLIWQLSNKPLSLYMIQKSHRQQNKAKLSCFFFFFQTKKSMNINMLLLWMVHMVNQNGNIVGALFIYLFSPVLFFFTWLQNNCWKNEFTILHIAYSSPRSHLNRVHSKSTECNFLTQWQSCNPKVSDKCFLQTCMRHSSHESGTALLSSGGESHTQQSFHFLSALSELMKSYYWG